MKVQICLTSGLSECAAIPAEGELTSDADTLSITWKDPPQGQEKSGSLNRLTYRKQAGVLNMVRSGDHSTNLTFSEDKYTEGILSTEHGDFLMEIETVQLVVPDELWLVPGGTDLFCQARSGKSILIRYLLHLSGQEPMQNDIVIQIGLEKNDE